jgi:hypothetical protein
MRAVAIDLGTSHTSGAGAAPRTLTPPSATRSRSPGWQDPRLWVGVVVVAGSVLLGARVVGAADDTVTVWAAAEELAPGATLAADDLVAVRVRFAEDTDLAAYLPTSAELPAEATLTRGVGAGELVPTAALGDAEDTGLLQLPIAVEPEQLAGAVSSGTRVNVYLVARGGSDRGYDSGEPVLEDVAVLDASLADEGYAASGLRRLVLAVPEEDAGRFYGLLGSLSDPLVSVAARG